MSYNQHELGRRFQRGETTGTASNMKIHETDQGGTILVGYGHAVYALRTAEGFIVTFAGWANSSNARSQAGSHTTKCHFSTAGLTSEKNVDVILNGPGIIDAPKKVGFNSRKYEDLWLADTTA
jgi:hypothetical protein